MSYIHLKLDTTAPTIEISAPKYTTREMMNVITIKANERIAKVGKLHVTDPQGFTKNLDFSLSGDTIKGIIRFNDLALGNSTLYVQVYDDVWNMSDLYTHTFVIKENLSHLKLTSNITGIIPLTNIKSRTVISKIK